MARKDLLKGLMSGDPPAREDAAPLPRYARGAIGAVILIDHNAEAPLQELESYLETFQNYTDNIAIGITHVDGTLKSTNIYKEWLLRQELFSPLFFIDARKKDDVLLLLEALITSVEVNHNIFT